MDSLLKGDSYKHSLIIDEIAVLDKDPNVNNKKDTNPNAKKANPTMMQSWVNLVTPPWISEEELDDTSMEDREKVMSAALHTLKKNSKQSLHNLQEDHSCFPQACC